eukprot:214760-Chlamydomonas_euryale.AAC.1
MLPHISWAGAPRSSSHPTPLILPGTLPHTSWAAPAGTVPIPPPQRATATFSGTSPHFLTCRPTPPRGHHTCRHCADGTSHTFTVPSIDALSSQRASDDSWSDVTRSV